MIDQPRAPNAFGESPAPESYRAAIYRFRQESVAKSYPAKYGTGWRDRREVSSIRRALANVPRGAEVLDLPCGSGRLMELLVGAGYRVTCADRSEYMLEMTRRRWDEI